MASPARWRRATSSPPSISPTTSMQLPPPGSAWPVAAGDQAAITFDDGGSSALHAASALTPAAGRDLFS